MKLTKFIASLTVLSWLVGWLVAHITQKFYPAFYWVYLLSSIACLERGIHIRKQSWRLGWLCIVLGLIPLIVVWVVILRHEMKIHA